jgi:hypothetical protein
MEDMRFNPVRDFAIWKYHVGHRKLLLRSTKERSHAHGTRLDIIIFTTSHIFLPTEVRIDLLRILTDDELAKLRNEPSLTYEMRGTEKAYGFFLGDTCIGYVIGRSINSHEDIGSYIDKSVFDPLG